MPNHAINQDPSNWEEYFFNQRVVRKLKTFIERSQHPFALTLSGATGTGKTCAARLYIKSVLCRNRPAGSSNPCGNCAVCKQDPRTMGAVNNVVWVQQGRDESITQQFNLALQEAYQPPNGFDEDHRNYKFIVIDEVQSIPKDKLQQLLFYPELGNIVAQNRVIFIFITMDESKVDSVVMQALADRSEYLRFRALTQQEMEFYLHQHYPDLHPESVQILAHYAKGSLRRLLNAIGTCAEEDEYLSPSVVAETLYYCGAKTRSQLWALLEARDYRGLKAFWDLNHTKVDEDLLIQQMLTDLDQALINSPRPDHLRAQEVLYIHLTSRRRIQGWDAIKMLAGMELGDIHQIPLQFADSRERNGADRYRL